MACTFSNQMCARATGNILKRMCNSISIKTPWCINKREETISTNAGNYSNALRYGHGCGRALCTKGVRSRRYAACKEATNLPQRTHWHIALFIHLEKKPCGVVSSSSHLPPSGIVTLSPTRDCKGIASNLNLGSTKAPVADPLSHLQAVLLGEIVGTKAQSHIE